MKKISKYIEPFNNYQQVQWAFIENCTYQQQRGRVCILCKHTWNILHMNGMLGLKQDHSGIN